MRRKLSLIILGMGWLLLALFLFAGYYSNKLAGSDDQSSWAGIIWPEQLQLFEGGLQCLLTDESLLERKQFLKTELFPQMIRKEASENGFTYYFDDDPILLGQLFEFIQKEKACCPFFKFDISILPFKKGLALQISGSEAALEFLEDFETNEI